ncbi:hypothetical protein [Microbacterium dauci]|uniref:PKD domain-containing protein n=1 Tax=Microbacterium dauci TaxID=3048008 RepID=A0ABT6ZG88_9MICO|nr:hypothetical protein [Microbacterium sp. LX3-4]MDJ1115179.1 hypothetical protein [Microbacterium sp. LX3-4]
MTIGAEQEVEHGGRDGGSGSTDGPGGRTYPEFVPADELPEPIRVLYPGGVTSDLHETDCAYEWFCDRFALIPTDPESTGPDVTTATIDDVAAYAPTPTGLQGEPGGMGVVGMPTNFVVDVQTHSVDGEIFDVPVTVRFTPVGYTFHFGDGTSRETTTAGTSWDELGAPQFTATDTSHAYAEAGTYAASVDVEYAAEGDAGFGWFPVAGTLERSTPDTTIRIVEVETALVERTCVEDPAGAGC